MRVVNRGVLARRQEELRRTVLAHGLAPQAGAVGVRELAHGHEDEFLELADIPFGREGDPDAVQLLELAVLPPRLLLELLDLTLERRVFHPRAQELAERRSGGIVWHRERHGAEALRRFLAPCV